MDAKSSFHLGVAIVLLIIELLIWYVLLKYKNHRLVKVRGISTMFATAGGWSITGVIWNFAVAFNWPGLPVMIILIFCHVIVALFYIEKFAMILINFAINQEAVNYVIAIQNAMDNGTGKDASVRSSLTVKPIKNSQTPFSKGWSKWIFNHRHYFSSKWNSPAKLFTMSIVCTMSIIFSIVFAAQPESHVCRFNSDACFAILMWWWRFAFLSGMMTALSSFASFFEFLKVKEGFFLKKELLFYFFLSIFAASCFSYRLFAPMEFQMQYDRIVSWYGLIFLALGGLYNKGVLLYLINKMRKEQKLRMCNEPSTERMSSKDFHDPVTPREKVGEMFNKLLHDDDERLKFRNFLLLEFAVENLLFWEEIELLKMIDSPDQKCTKASQIYDEFCTEDSKLTVNLSFAQFGSLKAMHDKLHDANVNKQEMCKEIEEVFSTAQHEIVQLMLTGLFPRYRKHVRERGLSRQMSSIGQSTHSQQTPRSPNSPTGGAFFPEMQL